MILQSFQLRIHGNFLEKLLGNLFNSFNQLDLPEYRSKDVLKRKLLLAITEGRGGFGFV